MPHYYSEKQQSPFKPFEIPVRLKDIELRLLSASGVFSMKHLDKGTEVLLTYMQLPDDEARILDLGCGYGVIAIVAKLRNPALEVVASDVNERAVLLSRMNLEKCTVEMAVVKSDLFANLDGNFDCILTNPPYVAGRELLFKLIEESCEHLNEGGSLQLVARHNKGGKVLQAKMEEVFGNVSVLGKGAGFRVYCSVRACEESR